MRPTLRYGFPLLFTLAMTGCHQQASLPVASGSARAIPPSSPTNANAWEDYMVKVSHSDLKDIAAKPYLFEVLAPSDPKANERNPQIQQALTQMANNNQFPGNAIAVAGPDPRATANVLNKAFGAAKPGSLTGLTVLYIGNDADKPMVEKAITAAGATFRFAKM